MSVPPLIRDKLFDEIDTHSAAHVEKKFAPLVFGELHPFLNRLPCLSDFQTIRTKWKARTRSSDAFGTFKAEPRHWYSFNHGGRREGQLNIGMSPAYFRVGLGFEFTEKQGGSPSDVTLAYAVFRNVTGASADYTRFVTSQHIEVEYFPTTTGDLGHESTGAVVGWEPPASPTIQWIFFGRLLRRGTDRHILESRDAFGEILKDVLCGFKPFWARAQEQVGMMK